MSRDLSGIAFARVSIPYTLSLCLSPLTQGPLPHPENPDAKDVAPTPLLLVATTDGVLRFFCFGHLKRQQVGGGGF